ncbi:hypothetical protein [Piscinibacter sp. XHJ-5]|uniref:hypothetical protein n=1 Tax=Piscinibacter sp. XHJ-5 TaxID=3037797 RepID=UPI002453113F|nr:hypothetical protein [Piscinibacter sp. XHJ-5]
MSGDRAPFALSLSKGWVDGELGFDKLSPNGGGFDKLSPSGGGFDKLSPNGGGFDKLSPNGGGFDKLSPSGGRPNDRHDGTMETAS